MPEQRAAQARAPPTRRAPRLQRLTEP